MDLKTLKLEYLTDSIAQVSLNRPEKLNAMSRPMYAELKQVFQALSKSAEVRVIILTGNSQSFCAGMDLKDFYFYRGPDAARAAFIAQEDIKPVQDCISSIEECKKPVIAAVSGFCIGAGVDIITACCIRICSKTTLVSVKEIALGITADLGVLQRMPKIVGNDSWVRELVYTGKNVRAEEALRFGLFSSVHDDYDNTMKAAFDLAKNIASKSPVALTGCKTNLNFSRDHSVREGLEFAVYWNSWALQTADFDDSVKAMMEKKKVNYPKL